MKKKQTLAVLLAAAMVLSMPVLMALLKTIQEFMV